MNLDNGYSSMESKDQQKFQEKLKDIIEEGEAVKRLSENADFKKIFMENYFTVEPKRLVLLMGDPAVSTNENSRMSINERLIAIAQCNNFIRETYAKAANAKYTLEELMNPKKQDIED